MRREKWEIKAQNSLKTWLVVEGIMNMTFVTKIISMANEITKKMKVKASITVIGILGKDQDCNSKCINIQIFQYSPVSSFCTCT